MRLAAIALATLFLARALHAQDDARAVREWAARSARPLRTIDPAGDQTDLAPLHDIVHGARLIGMGESKHAMHELLQLRLRVLRYLIEHEGVSALAMESALPEGAAVNAWIVGDTDTPPDFAKSITYFGMLRELHDAFRWLREHNMQVPRERRVRYYGIDMSQGAGTMHPAIDSVWRWLDRVDPTFARESRTALADVIARYGDDGWPTLAARYDSLGAAGKDSLRQGVDALVAHLTGHGVEYVARTSPVEYDWYARLARTLQQTEVAARVGLRVPSNPRDVAMADNMTWVLERERGRGPVVVWAHNGHLQSVPMTGPKLPIAGSVATTGEMLRRTLGPAYVRLGTTYGTLEGDTTRIDPTSIDAVLASVGRPTFLIDMRTPHDARVEQWLDTAHPMHFEWGDLDVAPRRAFDALFFVERISPARPASR